MKKGIVLHDFFEIKGGGERLVLTLAKGLDFDLCFGFWTKNSYDKKPSLKGIRHVYDLKAQTSIIGWRTIKQMRAFAEKTASFLPQYDVAIYSGVDAPLAVFNHLKGANVFYCHTPPRFIYDKKEFYLSLYPFPLRWIMHLLIRYIQPRYESAVRKMDLIIANSQNVRTRIKKYLGLDSIVIYPPCNTEKFKFLGQKNYYLSTARVDPLKRVDIIVKSFLKMPDKNLIVISGGSDLPKIKKMAQRASNIRILGWVTEEKLRELMGHCIATIYIPRDEDFGISPVESMAAGKPVIGVKEGGLMETIVDGETGILIPPDPDEEDIIRGVSTLTPKLALSMRRACEERAKLFDRKSFLDQIKEVLYF